MAKHARIATDPVLEAAGNLGSIGLTLRGVDEGLRRVCDRGTDTPWRNEDHCLVALLYERLRARRKGEPA